MQVEIIEGCRLPLCFEDITAGTGGDGKGGKNVKKKLFKSPRDQRHSRVGGCAKQSQAAELTVGAGVALVGMVGLVFLPPCL